MYDHHKFIAYQKSKLLTKLIVNLCSQIINHKSGDVICRQIVRSSASIGANIAEGFGRNNTKEYKQFLGIAKGSSLETEYWLELIFEIYNVSVSDIINLNKEIIKLLTATIKSLDSR